MIPAVMMWPAPSTKFTSRASGRFGEKITPVTLMSFHLVSGDPHGFYGTGVLDILERTRPQHDQVRPLALLQCTEVLGPEKLGRILRGDRNDLLGRETGFGHQLHLPMLEVPLNAL